MADGALGEVHDMIQRLEELSVKAANGTNRRYDDEAVQYYVKYYEDRGAPQEEIDRLRNERPSNFSFYDRQMIQDEIGQLLTEINRISDTTKFNEHIIFGGSDVKKMTATLTSPATPIICGDFTVQGGTLGKDFVFIDGVLTVKTSTAVMIRNTAPGTATANRIEVASGVNANIILKDVNIDVSGQADKATFKIADNSTGNVHITIEGTNTLKSGHNCAGLQKNGEGSGIGKLTISGVGSLTATSVRDGAGIGGGNRGASSNITISGGTVTATGGNNGAGIGGGYRGVGSNITINGGSGSVKGGTDAQNIGSGKETSDGTNNIVGDNSASADATDRNGVPFTWNLPDKGTPANPTPPTLTTTVELIVQSSNNLWIQSGYEAGDGMFMAIDAMNTAMLGLDGMNVTTAKGADDAMKAVNSALAYVSALRSKIGAYQNRLEHTIANEGNIVENTTAAESRIRDTDMAKEMVRYSNLNILQQAGQSMLAQANQSKQGVLGLVA